MRYKFKGFPSVPRLRVVKGSFTLLVGVLCLRAERAYALRCGNRVVVLRASTAEVVAKCGEPVARAQR